ncbi:MAG: glucosaminidase domain-containing protein, partial [Clostridia bacterium]|nr:glucosaminidase domain-containing protein [Clostridia bacterium]
MKRSKFISFLLAVVMLFCVAVMPFSAVSAVDLDDYNLTTVQKYFYRVIGSLARADYYETDVLASITLAQAIYEGGWGRYSLPVGGCNLFGIKAYKTWGGMVYDQKTSMLYSSYDDYLFTEGQGHLNTYSAWRAHVSWAESVSVHSSLFLNESKYAAVVGEKDYKVAAREIVEAGYCNDYGYIETVISLIEQYDMTEYDDLTPDEDGVVAVVTKQERKLLDIGETYQIPLTYYPADKTASSLSWKSDNESVATVDENGLVTAISHGMTLVTASLANGREAACIIYVDCN